MTGALVGFGVPEFEAKRYETRLGKGGILLSVHADNADWICSCESDSGKDRCGGRLQRQ